MTHASETTSRQTRGHPLVSVLVTNHNYGSYLREALDSVLAQTYEPIQLVVVDDDDLFLPEKVERVAAWMELPSAKLVYHRLETIDAHGGSSGAPGLGNSGAGGSVSASSGPAPGIPGRPRAAWR